MSRCTETSDLLTDMEIAVKSLSESLTPQALGRPKGKKARGLACV